MKFSLSTLVGENCITFEQGQTVYEAIHPPLKNDHKVELDFSGVHIFASPFFNAAIGRLLRDIPAESLNRLLYIHDLTPAGLDVLRHVIDNSKEYYSNQDTREALDKLLSDHDQA